MNEDQKYKVIIEETNGWFTYEKAEYLTRAEGIEWVDNAMKDGVSPDRLRVVRQEWGQ